MGAKKNLMIKQVKQDYFKSKFLSHGTLMTVTFIRPH